MKIKLIVGVMLIMFSLNANAAEWYAASQTADGSTVYLVDKTSINGPKSKRKFWSMMIQADKPGYVLWQYEVNCIEKSITQLEYISYKNDYGDVDISLKHTSSSGIVPDSVLEGVAGTVCTGKYSGGTATKVDVGSIKAQLKSRPN